MLAFNPIPPSIDNLWLFLLVGSLSACLFSMAKAGFGGGIGMLAVPLMVYACGGQASLAVGIMLPMLIAADYVAVLHWWRKWNVRAVAGLLPGVLVGVTGAYLLLRALQDAPGQADRTVNAALKIGIGAIALVFVTLRILQAVRGKGLVFRPRWPQAVGVGTVAGLTSTVGHAAGPVAAMYLLPQQMPKSRYVATTALLFWCVNQIKLPFYFSLGLVNAASLLAGAVLIPAIVAGAALGVVLHRRVGEKSFQRLVYTLLTLAGGHLIYKGITALLA